MARGMPTRAHGMHARRNLIGRCKFCIVDVHVTTRNLTQPSGVIEVEVPEEHYIDVLRCESQLLKVAGRRLNLGRIGSK